MQRERESKHPSEPNDGMWGPLPALPLGPCWNSEAFTTKLRGSLTSPRPVLNSMTWLTPQCILRIRSLVNG